jgi:hypothetical protein
MLLQLAASLQEMESNMSGVNCAWAVVPIVTAAPDTVTSALPPPQSTHNSKKRGRPRKDPAAAAVAAEQKMRDAHNEGVVNWTKVFEERKRFLDAGIDTRFPGWERDVARLREEQSQLDAMDEAYDNHFLYCGLCEKLQLLQHSPSALRLWGSSMEAVSSWKTSIHQPTGCGHIDCL